MNKLLKFYEMTAEEQAAITKAIAAGGNDVEIYTPLHATWYQVGIMSSGKIYVNYYYRLKTKALNIPWDIIDKRYNYAILNKDGRVQLGTGEFYMDDGSWCQKWDHVANVCCLAIDTSGINWETSQVERP